MKNLLTLMASLLLMSVCLRAGEQQQLKLNDDVRLRYGGDLRARWEGFDRAVVSPDTATDAHLTQQYLRVRARLWGALDLGEDLTLNLRLATRFHHVSASPSDPNNNGASTWEFPEEVFLDDANLEIRRLLGDERLSAVIGRQSLKFGNGMILSERTPFDQGRSVYTDGLKLQFKDDATSVAAFILYDRYKDHAVFINDKNRRLRSGDNFTAGLYATHRFSPAFAVDAYYLFDDLDDIHPTLAERCHPADASLSLHTVGTRLFGRPVSLIEYSLEGARQFGRDANGNHLAGEMVDGRLLLHLADYLPLTPVLTLNATHFSGDKPGSNRNEGWQPLHSQCPLWGEELIPIMINGNWTNLQALKLEAAVNPVKPVRLALSATQYLADENGGNLRSNTGDNFGLLLSTALSYKFSDHLAFLFQLSHFNPGDYFADGHKSIWGRFEVTLAF